ncbi:MAG TPA: UbiA-like polyprenyltransferase [Fibrobacteraceae bacterium]|nr:UbiA-like polyprenyltransferase [Fibrobacteraceae bacterium]
MGETVIAALRQTRMFLELVRFSHTLFALPFALASMLMAAQGLPDWRTLGLILLCMATARSSAMAFNRLADVRYDAANPRTAQRHLPSGKLSKAQVLAFIIFNGGLFLFGAALLNRLAFVCALPVWLFLLSYSFWKRYFWTCHLFLGAAIGMSPLGAWIAVRGEFALFPVLLGLMLLFWIAGFDIIYATQDEASDREQGLHSIPVQFGIDAALRIALILHLAMLVTGIIVGFGFHLPWPWWISQAACGLALLFIHTLRKSSDLDRMNGDFFVANILVSLFCLTGIGCVVLVSGGFHAP